MDFSKVPYLYAGIPIDNIHITELLKATTFRKDLFITYIRSGKKRLYTFPRNRKTFIVADQFSFHLLLSAIFRHEDLCREYQSYERAVFLKRYEEMYNDDYDRAIEILGFTKLKRLESLKETVKGDRTLFEEMLDVFGASNIIEPCIPLHKELIYVHRNFCVVGPLMKRKEGFLLFQGVAFILKPFILKCLEYIFDKFFEAKMRLMRFRMQDTFIRNFDQNYRGVFFGGNFLSELLREVQEKVLQNVLSNGKELIEQMDVLPPCMHFMLTYIKEKGGLRNHQRVSFVYYLKRFGMDKEWIKNFLEKYYNPIGRPEMFRVLEAAFADRKSMDYSCKGMMDHEVCVCARKDLDVYLPLIVKSINRRDDIIDIEDLCQYDKNNMPNPKYICTQIYRKYHGDPVPFPLKTPVDYYNKAIGKGVKIIPKERVYEESYLNGEQLQFYLELDEGIFNIQDSLDGKNETHFREV